MEKWERGRFYASIIVIAMFLLPLATFEDAAAQGDYRYYSTGVGKDAREEKVSPEFTLKLVFASTKGELLAKVNVDIESKDGKKLLSAVSDGPWFFVKLPPGVYNVAATFRNCTVKSGGVKVTSGATADVVMRWNLEKGACP